MFDELKRRADSGDALASCRLAVELIECRQTALLAQTGFLENFESVEKDLVEKGMVAGADSMASMQIKHLESSNRCIGISKSQMKLAGSYLSQAAKAGIGEAIIRFVEGEGLETRNSAYGLLQDKAFDQWRRNAPELLQRALKSGEPSTVMILMSAYSDDNSLIGGLIVDNPAQAHSYLLLRERLRGKSEPLNTDLTPSQIGQARQNSARMHADYFDNTILTDPDAFRSPLTPAWALPDGAAPRRPCE